MPEDEFDAWENVDPRGGELLPRSASLRPADLDQDPFDAMEEADHFEARVEEEDVEPFGPAGGLGEP